MTDDAAERHRLRGRRPIVQNRCSSSARSIRSGCEPTYIAPAGFPLRSLGDVNQDRRIVAYAARARGRWRGPSHRRVVLRRSRQRRQRPAALHGAAADRHVRASASSTSTAATTRRSATKARSTPNWLVEASFARAQNTIVEIPSVNQWSVTDNTVTPQVLSGGIGFYEVGNDGMNCQYQAKATNVIRGPQPPLRPRVRGHRLLEHDQPHRPDVHAARRHADRDRRADRDPAGPHLRSDLPRRPRQHQPVRDTTQHYLERSSCRTPGRRQPADDQSRHPLRAADADRHAGGSHARQQLGAAHRRDLRSRPAAAR